jgi:ActD protein
MADADVLYGLFSKPEDAERGMQNLRAAGVAQEKLVVMSSEPFEEYSFSHCDHGNLPLIGVVGGIIGFLVGLGFVWYSQISYPIPTAGMPIFTKWPVVIIAYELTMLGAVIASIVAMFVSAKLPDFKKRFYDPEVSNGKILIGVMDPSVSSRADLEKRLRSAGADQIKVSGSLASA